MTALTYAISSERGSNDSKGSHLCSEFITADPELQKSAIINDCNSLNSYTDKSFELLSTNLRCDRR